MLHHRRRLLLALTPLIIIGLVAAILALRLAGMPEAQTQVVRFASSGVPLDPSGITAAVGPAPRRRRAARPARRQADRRG